MRDSMIFYKEWKDAIEGLPNEVRLEIYDATIEYGTSGKLPELKPMAAMAFRFIKSQIDRDSQKYLEQIEKKRAAGRKHKGNQYKKAVEQNGTNGTNGTGVPSVPTNGTNGTDNVYVDVTHNNESKEKESSKEDKKKNVAPAVATLPKRQEDFYESLIPYVGRYGKEMVRVFFDYWTEPNKSRSKMRFELEKTWDLGRRLATWANREKTKSINNGSNRTDNTARMYQEGAELIEELINGS